MYKWFDAHSSGDTAADDAEDDDEDVVRFLNLWHALAHKNQKENRW